MTKISGISGNGYIYKTDGTVEHRTYEAAPSLEGLKEAVGGYIETVPYWTKYNGKACVVFCNEEGKLHKLPFNITATKLWLKEVPQMRGHDVLVGDIIVLQGNKAFMESI